jgi:hypothetical protein
MKPRPDKCVVMNMSARIFAAVSVLGLVGGCGAKPPGTLPRLGPADSTNTFPVDGSKEAKDSGAANANLGLLALDWKALRMETQADALAVWAQIAPTGADWRLKLAEIPSDDKMRTLLAQALLNGGNFACPVLTAADHCGVATPVDFFEMADNAGFADPCLRRELAFWSLAQLNDTDATSVEDGLLDIAKLPAPEQELISAGFDLLPVDVEGDRLALLMIEQLPDASSRELKVPTLSVAAAEIALTKLRYEPAAEVLNPAQHESALLQAVHDSKISSQRRFLIAKELLQPSSSALGVRKAVIDDLKSEAANDCRIGGIWQAANGAAVKGSSSKSPKEHFRAVCRAFHAGTSIAAVHDKRSISRTSQMRPGDEIITDQIDHYETAEWIRDLLKANPDLVSESACRQIGPSTVCVAGGQRLQFDFKLQAGAHVLSGMQIASGNTSCETIDEYVKSLRAN